MTPEFGCLYSFAEGEEEEVHRLFVVPEVYAYLTDGVPPSRSLTEDWIRAARASREVGGGLWLLRQQTERTLLGLARLYGEEQGALELTYVLNPSAWGRGLATRMAHTVMDIAFSSGKVSSIWAGADTPNAASIAVMHRLGMTFLREVQYPAGSGVEYAIQLEDFDSERLERLKLVA